MPVNKKLNIKKIYIYIFSVYIFMYNIYIYI